MTLIAKQDFKGHKLLIISKEQKSNASACDIFLSVGELHEESVSQISSNFHGSIYFKLDLRVDFQYLRN